jgi:hypothetical protein
MGGGRAGLGGKEGGPVAHSQIFYKTFLAHYSKPQFKLNERITELVINGKKCGKTRVYTKDWPTEK